MKLVKSNSHYLDEEWIVEFYDHKPLSFATREDLEKYLSHELSTEHGYMEYDRVPNGVKHIVNYNIDWEVKERNDG